MNVAVEKVKSDKTEEANKVIRNYALGSIVPSLLPIPLVDLAIVTGVQLKMLHSLANIYDVPFKEELVRSSISALLGGTVALSMGRVVSSAVKAVPVVGSLVGAYSMPVVNFGATYAIGKVFVQHFESGGTMLSFDPSKVREYFKKQFEAGKAVIASAQASGEVGKDGTVKKELEAGKSVIASAQASGEVGKDGTVKKELEAGKSVIASTQASGEVGKDGTVKKELEAGKSVIASAHASGEVGKDGTVKKELEAGKDVTVKAK